MYRRIKYEQNELLCDILQFNFGGISNDQYSYILLQWSYITGLYTCLNVYIHMYSVISANIILK